MQVKDRGPRGHGGRPMKTLAIDTSLATGSVAALDGDRVAMRPLGAAGQHARLLAGALADVAAELGWRPRHTLAEAMRLTGNWYWSARG